MKPNRHPNTTPIESWPLGWLRLECCSILTPTYLIMNDDEKRSLGYPITKEEMVELIKSKRP
jgi:hypothetical protein